MCQLPTCLSIHRKRGGKREACPSNSQIKPLTLNTTHKVGEGEGGMCVSYRAAQFPDIAFTESICNQTRQRGRCTTHYHTNSQMKPITETLLGKEAGGVG